MAFHDIRFPANLSFGSVGGPERRTEIVTLANGFEERNTPWVHSRRRYDAGLGLRSLSDLETLVAFFEARMGQLHGFRWKDWGDYSSAIGGHDVSAMDQDIAIGDGETVEFPLCKIYRSGPASYSRPITKPVAGSVRVALGGDSVREGVDWAIDGPAGVITFNAPPEAGVVISAGYEFDVPVRFDTDRIQISIANFRAGEVPNVPVIEVRQ
ncbi:DUF2460 domain-containing protein [Donghicola tyrosinivorans]|uniref:Uncharacterized protein (TIGR02217 family) n=1 Tax=Donghicola tyrosinivorans TaxID=1652492 RepID=A0A2T0WTW2_9RHOB|nr:DUF2460 domain-containing protein [Donghicola tyrosinivorans]PRY90146.1 uncharacterized protein (TIGR02217 family) [Donghicola tyrosinivorans]